MDHMTSDELEYLADVAADPKRQEHALNELWDAMYLECEPRMGSQFDEEWEHWTDES